MRISWLDVAGLTAVSVLILVCFMLSPEKLPVEDCINSRNIVVAIGGCDRGAVCAVAFSDGSRGKTSYPLVGDVVYRGYKNDDRYFKTCD